MDSNDIAVDLISDTATRPDEGMLRAMTSARLGDEQKGEDPTVRALEETAAALLGTETALFLPSATMANQIALSLHAQAGDEIICHKTAHVFNYETGGTAITAAAQLYVLDTPRGIFGGDDVRGAIRADDPHLSDTCAVVVENTSNGGGGTVWPDAAYESVVAVCREHDLKLHIDGARLCNAAAARNVEPSFWGERADTVQMCFSKGLGCPFGAVLGMPHALWRRARRRKQSLGGALRQGGVIAGAMLYALKENRPKLLDDHRRAHGLYTALADIDGIEIAPPETNLVFFRLGPPHGEAWAFCAQLLDEHSVRMAPTIDGRVRACFHLDVDDAGLARTIDGVRAVLG